MVYTIADRVEFVCVYFKNHVQDKQHGNFMQDMRRKMFNKHVHVFETVPLLGIRPCKSQY